MNQTVMSILEWLLSSGLKIFIIAFMTLLIIKGGRLLSERFLQTLIKHRHLDDEFQKRIQTLSAILRYVLNITIFSVAAAMVLEELGIDIGPILAAAGILGLAIGFGAQNLVRDILSGFFIFMEDQIRVGDIVEVAGKSGVVERMNLKMTVLRDISGNVHFVPNGEIQVVTNMTKGFSMYVFEIPVAYKEDVDRVVEVMKEVDEEMHRDDQMAAEILQPLEIFGLDRFGDSCMIVKARITTKPSKQWHIAREFNRKLKKKFDEKNIQIPYPQITLNMEQSKDIDRSKT